MFLFLFLSHFKLFVVIQNAPVVVASPEDGLQVPERVAAALVDEVLLDDGVGRDPVCSVAGREGTPLEYHHKVGNMEISYQEALIIPDRRSELRA